MPAVTVATLLNSCTVRELRSRLAELGEEAPKRRPKRQLAEQLAQILHARAQEEPERGNSEPSSESEELVSEHAVDVSTATGDVAADDAPDGERRRGRSGERAAAGFARSIRQGLAAPVVVSPLTSSSAAPSAGRRQLLAGDDVRRLISSGHDEDLQDLRQAFAADFAHFCSLRAQETERAQRLRSASLSSTSTASPGMSSASSNSDAGFPTSYDQWQDSLAHRGAGADTNWLIFAVRTRQRRVVLRMLGAALPDSESSGDEDDGSHGDLGRHADAGNAQAVQEGRCIRRIPSERRLGQNDAAGRNGGTRPTTSGWPTRGHGSGRAQSREPRSHAEDWLSIKGMHSDESNAVLFDTCEEDANGHSAFAHAVQWGDHAVLVALILYDRREWWQPAWTALLEALIRNETQADLDALHAVFQAYLQAFQEDFLRRDVRGIRPIRHRLNPPNAEYGSFLNFSLKFRKRQATRYLLGHDPARTLVDKHGDVVMICDPNAKDQFGFAPFHHAVAWADKEVLLWCMQYASGWQRPWNASWALGKQETKLDAINDAGETALIIAAKSSNQMVINLLCDVYHYRNRSDASFFYATEISRGKAHGSNPRDTHRILNMRDATGRTALSHSCAGPYETIDIIRKLLDAAADPSFADKDGVSPLHFAISRAYTRTAKCLIDNGADINARTQSHSGRGVCVGGLVKINDTGGWTALHLACHLGLFPIAQYLLQHGADALAATEPAGKTVLHIVVEAQRALRDGLLDICDQDNDLMSRLEETQGLLIREEPELLTIGDRNGQQAFQRVDRKCYFDAKLDDIALNIELYNDPSEPKRQAAQRFFSDRLLHTVVQDRWDVAVKPHKRRELEWHLVLLGAFSLLVIAHFRQHPQFPADEFLDDLLQRSAAARDEPCSVCSAEGGNEACDAQTESVVAGSDSTNHSCIPIKDGKLERAALQSTIRDSYLELRREFGSMQQASLATVAASGLAGARHTTESTQDGFLVLGQPTLSLLEGMNCAGYDGVYEFPSSVEGEKSRQSAFENPEFLDCLLHGHRPARGFSAVALRALVRLPPANLVELVHDGFLEWILDAVDHHDGTYVALALQWGCTVDSMPQELCMDGASSTSLQPLAYSHFAQRGVLFQLLLLASLILSLVAALRTLHRLGLKARWKPLLVLASWAFGVVYLCTCFVVDVYDPVSLPAFVGVAVLGTRTVIVRLKTLDHAASLRGGRFEFRDLMPCQCGRSSTAAITMHDHHASVTETVHVQATDSRTNTRSTRGAFRRVIGVYRWIWAVLKDWVTLAHAAVVVLMALLLAMPVHAHRVAAGGGFYVADIEQGYAVEQFAFATVVSFLWIQTFASLEGYETVQVLLVSIRDMLQALGGFSLILTVSCSAFAMAYFTMRGAVSMSWVTEIIIGNLHSAVKGDSHDTTDTTSGFVLTFLFDISVVLILMSVMESILVALYEKSQENAKMIRCYTQAYQIFAFGVEGRRATTLTSGAAASNASGVLQTGERHGELTRMLKRSFGLFKPLGRWRDLKTKITRRDYSDTSHRHFFSHMLMLIYSATQRRSQFQDLFSPDILPELEFFTRGDADAAAEAQGLRHCLEFVAKLLANDASCMRGPNAAAAFKDVRQWCIDKFDLLNPHTGLMLVASTVAWCLGKLSTWSADVNGEKNTSIDKLCLLQHIMGDHHLYSTMLPTFGMLPAELRRVVRAGFDTGFTFGQLLQLECIEASLVNLRKLAETPSVTRIRPRDTHGPGAWGGQDQLLGDDSDESGVDQMPGSSPGSGRHDIDALKAGNTGKRLRPGTLGRSQSPSLLDADWPEGPGANRSASPNFRGGSLSRALGRVPSAEQSDKNTNRSPAPPQQGDGDRGVEVITGAQSMHLFLFCQTVYMFAKGNGQMLSFLWKMAKGKLVVLDTLQRVGRSPAAVYGDFLEPFIQVQREFPFANSAEELATSSLLTNLAQGVRRAGGAVAIGIGSPRYERCVARLLSMLRYRLGSGDRFMVDAVRCALDNPFFHPGQQAPSFHMGDRELLIEELSKTGLCSSRPGFILMFSPTILMEMEADANACIKAQGYTSFDDRLAVMRTRLCVALVTLKRALLQAKEHFGPSSGQPLVLVSLQGLVYSAKKGYAALRHTKFKVIRRNAGSGNELTTIRLRNRDGEL